MNRNHSDFFEAVQSLYHVRENSVQPQAPWAMAKGAFVRAPMKACVSHQDQGKFLRQVGRSERQVSTANHFV